MVEHLVANQMIGVRFSLPAHKSVGQNSNKIIDTSKIPDYVTRVTETLEKAGFEAFIVGGCVRDLILGREPKDWDVTTNAKPEQIQALFEKTVYENKFGTVAVIFENTDNKGVTHETPPHVAPLSTLDFGLSTYIVEVTPFRIEGKYSDSRHPDEVAFSDKIEDDLKRRDFTMNAMSFRISKGHNDKGHLVDLYKGHEAIKDMSVRTVGGPDERFQEDALRMLRAVRFACQLNFTISHETMESIVRNAPLLGKISAERIRDEFVKIIESPDPMMGIGLLQKLGLLKYVVPELEEGIGCEQGGAHIFDVFEHLLQALGHASGKNWPLHIRLSALFHDIGKPRSRRAGIKKAYTFYGHEVIGARMVTKIMDRLKFPKDLSELVVKLVRYHMFFSDTETITLSAVRRTIVNVGRENIWDLMQVRECDRVGMKKKEAPYRLRKYHAMIEEALRAPTSVGMLKIDGLILKNDLGIAPGPRMGWILHALLEECLEDPTTDGASQKNNLEYLKSRALELDKLSDTELKELGEKGKEKKEEIEEQEIGELRKKHGVI